MTKIALIALTLVAAAQSTFASATFDTPELGSSLTLLSMAAGGVLLVARKLKK